MRAIIFSLCLCCLGAGAEPANLAALVALQENGEHEQVVVGCRRILNDATTGGDKLADVRFLLVEGLRALGRATEARKELAALMRHHGHELEVRQGIVERFLPVKTGDEAIAERDADESAEEIGHLLETLVIPKIAFRDAPIQDVVTWLKEESRRGDPRNIGVNIFLQTSPSGAIVGEADPADPFAVDSSAEAGSDPFAADSSAEESRDPFAVVSAASPIAARAAPETDSDEASVSLELRQVTLGEALRMVALTAKLEMRVEKHAVIFSSKQFCLCGGEETRIYPANSSCFGGSPWGNSDASLLATFQSLGVNFEDGSRISYNPRTDKIIVSNHPHELRKIEALMAELTPQASQVHLDGRVVEVLDPSYLAALHPSRINAEVLRALPTDIVRESAVIGTVAISGNTAIVKDGRKSKTGVYYGTSVELTATISHDRYLIDLELVYQEDSLADDGNTIRRYTADRRVILWDREALAVPLSGDDDAHPRYLILEPTILNPAGLAVRKPAR